MGADAAHGSRLLYGARASLSDARVGAIFVTHKIKPYKLVPFPAERRVIVDAGRLAARRHIVHGLLEFDVTTPRELTRQHKANTGEALSFTAFIVACLAQAIAATPAVQAYRDWRNRLVLFDDVDVATLIEGHAGGVAVPHIIRAANRKTFRQIHEEIRSIQHDPARSAQSGGLTRLAQRVPGSVRDIVYWALRQNPHWRKAIAGTTIVTAVGMFAQASGWGIGFLPYHTLGLTVAGINSKPGVVQGQIEIREYLQLTISLDHDIVDGAPAARFVQQLKERIECGDVLRSGFGAQAIGDG